MRRFSILPVAIFLLFFPAQAQMGKLLWSKATPWGEVRVRQQGDLRLLMFADEEGETEESRMLMKAPHQPQTGYVKKMLAVSQAFTSSRPAGATPPSFLVVGLGGASLSNALRYHYPQARVTSIELEPVVVEAAKRFFAYKQDLRSLTVVDDARHFLESSRDRYDLIFLDAFDGVEVPETLRTVEFAQLLESHLQTGGAIVANVHFVPQQSGLRYQRSLLEVLPQRAMFAAGVAQGVGVFSRQPLLLMENAELVEAPTQDLQSAQPFHDQKR